MPVRKSTATKEKAEAPRNRVAKVQKPAAEAVVPSEAAKETRKGRYWQATGRRKEASAVVKIYDDGGRFTVNGKSLAEYFKVREHQEAAVAPISDLNIQQDRYAIDVRVVGGGTRGQAEAIRLGLARALVARNPEYRNRLRVLGYLTRDARVKERRKYGLKKARRAPQWQKR